MEQTFKALLDQRISEIQQQVAPAEQNVEKEKLRADWLQVQRFGHVEWLSKHNRSWLNHQPSMCTIRVMSFTIQCHHQ
eukprot:6173642-Prorocentrum_lima.AAC.1